MNGNNNEEKERELGDLLTSYIEMGEKIHELEIELGRLWMDPIKWREEFMAILKPAGFFVESVEQLVHHRDIYNVRVMRMMPGDKC